MASEYIGVNGVARKVPTHYIGVDGVARNVKSGYVGVDGVARLFFAPEDGSPVILEVEKVVSNTYANSTTYENEEFILLDIYPKTGGTVNVTYGGLTKTITDTSGAEEPNAQQVFFGTFNGVSDSVATPSSGTLTIEGDCVGFAISSFGVSKYSTEFYDGITSVVNFGMVSKIVSNAFYKNTKLLNVIIPNSLKAIGQYAFGYCTGLTSVTVPASIVSIDYNPWMYCSGVNTITVADGNKAYKMDGNCLIEIETNILIAGFENSIIPNYVEIVGAMAFAGLTELKSITIPASVTEIGFFVFSDCYALTDVIFLSTVPTEKDPGIPKREGLTITVPKGCGEAYKTAEAWVGYADYIVEAT